MIWNPNCEVSFATWKVWNDFFCLHKLFDFASFWYLHWKFVDFFLNFENHWFLSQIKSINLNPFTLRYKNQTSKNWKNNGMTKCIHSIRFIVQFLCFFCHINENKQKYYRNRNTITNQLNFVSKICSAHSMPLKKNSSKKIKITHYGKFVIKMRLWWLIVLFCAFIKDTH